MWKRIIIAAFAAATLSACEYEMDLGKITKAEQRLYVSAFSGAADTTFVTILKTYPLGQKEGDSKDLDIEKLSFTVDGNEIPLTRNEDGRWFNVGDCPPGSRIALSVKARGIDGIHSESTIPPIPDVSYSKEDMVFSAFPFTRHSFTFRDDPDSEDWYGVAITLIEYTTEEGEVYYHEGPLWIVETGEDNILGEMTAQRMDFRFESVWDGSARDTDIIFFRDEDLKDGKFTMDTSRIIPDEEYDYEQFERYDPETEEWIVSIHHIAIHRELRVSIFALSAECYRHMRAEFMKDNNGFAALGLSAPNFTWSNIDGGYGYFCGLSRKDLLF